MSRLQRTLRCSGLLLWLAGSTAALAEPLQVHLAGVVARPGVAMLPPAARLADAALAAQPLPRAYLLGAAWLRPGLIESQQRLKAGVLFDLASLRQRAQHRDRPALATLAAALHAWIAPMPVTGRRPALLDPRALEVDAAHNPPLAEGDSLYYPPRPRHVRVLGAVQRPCTLAQVPLQDARKYLAACASAPEADPDTIYVIEPDGRVFVQGIALWNRSSPLPLAPGALIYVPLRTRAIAPVDPDLNHDLAAFLATQLLPDPGAP